MQQKNLQAMGLNTSDCGRRADQPSSGCEIFKQPHIPLIAAGSAAEDHGFS